MVPSASFEFFQVPRHFQPTRWRATAGRAPAAVGPRALDLLVASCARPYRALAARTLGTGVADAKGGKFWKGLPRAGRGLPRCGLLSEV